MAAPHAPRSREQRQLDMLEAVSRALSGSLSVPEAVAEIAGAAGELIEFERMAVILRVSDDVLRVHAVMNAGAWNEGRLLRREECSARLWVDLGRPDIIRDARVELDTSFPMDREIQERGTRCVVRVPLPGRDGPLGMLVFSHPDADRFNEEHIPIASGVAALIAMALSFERMHRREVRRQSRLAAVAAVLPQIEEAPDLDETLSAISRLAKPILPHESMAIMVMHSGGAYTHGILPNGQRLVVEASPQFVESQLKGTLQTGYTYVRDIEIVDEAKSRVRLHLARGKERTQLEVELPPNAIQIRRDHGIRSQLRLAVHRGEEMVGLLVFSDTKPDAFDDDDVPIAMRFAERISLRLAQQQIQEEGKRASEAATRAKALEARVAELQHELEEARGPHAVVGVSSSWQEVLAQATRVAGTETTVLLTGESGTGKEVVARFLHHASKRAEGPFVALNCAALPEQLLEAELFGHEKGAFTGAASARIGRIEQAQGGVLFLDEVAEMSPSVQAKFLRVLQEREYQRLGSARVMKADVRIVAATNRDLKSMIARGDFREDLFYRLHVFAIHLPPLRERPDDVLALAEHFLGELGNALGRPSPGMTAAARELLRRCAWPGNARELRNVIERALILCDGGLILPEHLAVSVAATPDAEPVPAPAGVGAADGDGAGRLAGLGQEPLPEGGVDIESIERALVERAMSQAAGNKSKAAKLLGLTRAQLYSRLEKYSLG